MLLNVFRVVALIAGQAKQAFFENRIASVPQPDPEAQ